MSLNMGRISSQYEIFRTRGEGSIALLPMLNHSRSTPFMAVRDDRVSSHYHNASLLFQSISVEYTRLSVRSLSANVAIERARRIDSYMSASGDFHAPSCVIHQKSSSRSSREPWLSPLTACLLGRIHLMTLASSSLMSRA